jgi:hypothetical protein
VRTHCRRQASRRDDTATDSTLATHNPLVMNNVCHGIPLVDDKGFRILSQGRVFVKHRSQSII